MYVTQRGDKLRHSMPLSADLKYIRVGIYSYSFIHSFIHTRKKRYFLHPHYSIFTWSNYPWSELFNLGL